MSYSFEIINNDLQRGYTTSKYPKFALNHPDYIGYKLYDYNFDSLDLTSIDGKGKFISWLANGKYFSVKESEETKEYTIYCTNTLEKIIKTEGNATSFNCKGKWIFYAFNGDDTIFYDIVKV